MNDQLADIRPAYSLVFERESSHSPERLWHAITDSEEVSRWMSYPARIDLHNLTRRKLHNGFAHHPNDLKVAIDCQ